MRTMPLSDSDDPMWLPAKTDTVAPNRTDAKSDIADPRRTFLLRAKEAAMLVNPMTDKDEPSRAKLRSDTDAPMQT